MVNLKKNFVDVLEFVSNKTCIVICDLNMPIVDGKFSDFTRLDKIIPTLEKLVIFPPLILLPDIALSSGSGATTGLFSISCKASPTLFKPSRKFCVISSLVLM